MKTLCTTGHKISNADKKALEFYLLETPKEWSQSALNGMINKSIKTIYNDYIDRYKAKNESITASKSDIITAILSMEEFVPYKTKLLDLESPEREEKCDVEVWDSGFEIEDYEDLALRAFYEDPEQTLYNLIENKIAMRKKAFIRDNEPTLLSDSTVTSVPTKQDSFIEDFILRSDYKDRATREAEEI